MKTSVVEKLYKLMKETGMDTMLVSPSSNMVYILGNTFMKDERFDALVLCPDGEPFLFVNQVYRGEAEAFEELPKEYWSDGSNPWPIFQAACKAHGVKTGRMGVESSMQAGFLLSLMEQFPETVFMNNDQVTGQLRPLKQEPERQSMREACRRCTDSLKAVIGMGRFWVGKTEGEFAAALCGEMRKRGIEQAGALVCAGENAAVPHYLGNQSVIREDSCLLVDFGGSYEGYCSDMSRTFYVKRQDGNEEGLDEFVKVYQVVEQALYLGQKAARLGNRMEEVDRAARGYIDACGYGAYFTHRTGHGIGIDTHEEPCAAEGETCEIKAGMAFSIEPGIYLPGRFGIRIEDQALMTEEGLELLHEFPRELVLI